MKLEKIYLKIIAVLFYQKISSMHRTTRNMIFFIKFQKILFWAESQLLKESD